MTIDSKTFPQPEENQITLNEKQAEIFEIEYDNLTQDLTILGRDILKYNNIEDITDVFCNYFDKNLITGKIFKKSKITKQGEGENTRIYFDGKLIMEIDTWDNKVDSVQISEDLYEIFKKLKSEK